MSENRRCRGHSADGSRCGAPPELILESGFCWTHDPSKAEARAVASARGGATTKAKLSTRGLTEAELGPLESAADAQRWLKTVALAVAERRLTHSEGLSVTRAISEWMRCEDLRLRAGRLAELEVKVRELQGRKLGVVK